MATVALGHDSSNLSSGLEERFDGRDPDGFGYRTLPWDNIVIDRPCAYRSQQLAISPGEYKKSALAAFRGPKEVAAGCMYGPLFFSSSRRPNVGAGSWRVGVSCSTGSYLLRGEPHGVRSAGDTSPLCSRISFHVSSLTKSTTTHRRGIFVFR